MRLALPYHKYRDIKRVQPLNEPSPQPGFAHLNKALYNIEMSSIEDGFVALGNPQSSAQELLESVSEHTTVARPVAARGIISLTLITPDSESISLGYANPDGEFILQTPDEFYTHIGGAGREAIHRNIVFGEAALQLPGVTLLGRSFTWEGRRQASLRLHDKLAQLFCRRDDTSGIFYESFRPIMDDYSLTTGIGDMTPQQQERFIMKHAFSRVPTHIDGLVAAETEVPDGISADSDAVRNLFQDIGEQDAALGHLAEAGAYLPTLAKRAILTRHLLHQLYKGAALYDDDATIESIQTALTAGIQPIHYDEVHAVVRTTVAEAVDAYRSQTARRKYL